MSQSSSPVKVFLVDDSTPIRERVSALLAARDMDIVGQAATPHDSIERILDSCPDVVVLDISLEGGTGLEVLRGVQPVLPHIAFIVFSNNSGPAYRKRYLAEGALTFLDKSTEFDQLVPAIEQAAAA